MESFALLRRRTTDLLQSVQESMPSMPPMPSMPSVGDVASVASYKRMSGSAGHKKSPPTMKGTWEHISGMPHLPRSSHSVDVIAGSAYIFGGEDEAAREPVDNRVYVINLPITAGASADYFTIDAKPASGLAGAAPVVPIAASPPAAAAAATAAATAAPPTVAQKLEKGTKAEDDDDDSDNDEDDSDDDDEEESDEDESGSEGGDGPAPTPSTRAAAKAKAPEAPKPTVLGNVPAPRVGHATAVIGRRIFMFGGRGGASVDGDVLEEGGRVWVFDTRTRLWSYLDPALAAPSLALVEGATPRPDVPPARNYHSAVAVEKPGPIADTYRRPATTSMPAPAPPTISEPGGAKPSGLAADRSGGDEDVADDARPPSPRIKIKPLSRTDTIRNWALGDPAKIREVGTPQEPVVGNIAERAFDADEEGYGTFIIHGGCLAKSAGGHRARDLWAFDVRTRVWQRLPDAPTPACGGTALAVSRADGVGRIYRFGGFDGQGELGGRLDFLELTVDEFEDESEVLLTTRGPWQSLVRGDTGYQAQVVTSPSAAGKKTGPGKDTGKDDDEVNDDGVVVEIPLNPTAEKGADHHGGGVDADEWPGARSVASFEAVTSGAREYLVLMLGERAPSDQGHAAAGRFWDDVWAFQVPPHWAPASDASLGANARRASSAAAGGLAAIWSAVAGATGGSKGEGKWTRVELEPFDDEDEASVAGPGARGWVASAALGDVDESGVVVWGGLDGGNRRLGDGWIMRLG